MNALTLRGDRFLTRHFTRPSITWQQSMSIVLPLIAEHLFTSLFGLLNTAMISSSGVTSLSAVSLVDTLNSLLFVFYSGIATGASVVVANCRGSGSKEKLREASCQTVTTVTLFTLATTLFIILFHQPLLSILFGAAEAEILDKARLYLLGGAFTLPLVGFCTAVCGVLRGIGEGKTSLLYTLISTGAYVGLNVLFLTVLDMGIPGLILSITINRITNVPILFLFMHFRKTSFRFRLRELLRVNWSMFRSITKIGIPCALEQLFFAGGRVVIQSIIVPLGTNAIVTYNVAYSLMIFNQAINSPISSAMFTIVGICMGNDRPQDARELTKSYFVLCTAIYVLAGGLIALFFQPLAGMYHPPEELLGEIRLLVLISAIAHPLIHTAAFMLPNVFRAAGDVTYPTVLSLVSMWLCRVLGAYVLGITLEMGILGVWIAMLADWLLRAVLFPIRFRGEKWLRHKLVIK